MPPSPPLPREDLDHVLTQTLGLWEEARGRNFFITGGTGFFGIWLLETFAHVNAALGLGMSATVLTRDPARFAAKAPHLVSRPELKFAAGDVRSFPFPDGEFFYVVHAATESGTKLNEEAPQEMLDAIIGGTRRTLEFAARAGTQKLLLTSSGAVYGRQPPDLPRVPEEYPGAPDPLLPASAYGVGKRVAEHMCVVDARRSGFEAKIARCFAFVGPHLPLDAHFAIGNFIRDALRGGPVRVAGDGTPYRSYLYAADLAVWLWTILMKGQSGVAYNVGSEKGMPISEVAREVGGICTPPARVVIARQPAVGQPPQYYVPSTRRARAELHLKESVDFPEAIQKSIEWSKSLI